MSIEAIVHYVLVTVLVAIPIYIVIIGFRKLYLSCRPKRMTKLYREVFIHMFIFYTLCLYEITAIRLGLGLSIENITMKDARVNMIPIHYLWRWFVGGYWWHLTYNVAGNLAWFVPLGFFIPALFNKLRDGMKVTLIGMIISLSIEIIQYVLRTGVTDIDDIILNTIGAALGYLLWKIAKLVQLKWMRKTP